MHSVTKTHVITSKTVILGDVITVLGNMTSIVPAIIPESPEQLRAMVEKVADAVSEVQIDLVDGVFVPGARASWPWSSRTFLDEMYTVFADLSGKVSLEIDLMVERPERFVEELVSASVSRIVIHAGSTDMFSDILTFRPHVRIGLAFRNDTPLDMLHAHADQIDFVQCMGIREIGVQGNPFDERVLARVAEIHARYPALEVAVDGGVTSESAPRLAAQGAVRLIAGSAIFKNPNPRRAYEDLVRSVS